MRVRIDLGEGPLHEDILLPPVGGGGEADIRPLRRRPGFCAKIYRRLQTADQWAKLQSLTFLGRKQWSLGDHPRTAFPIGLCIDDDDRRIGFVMHQLTNPTVPLSGVLPPSSRARSAGVVTWRHCIALALDLVMLVEELHEAGVVVADLCLDNAFVSFQHLRVVLVDVDSFQLYRHGRRYASSSLRQEYCAPELLTAPTGVWRNANSDLTGLGVTVGELLLEGFHPFASFPRKDDGFHDDDREAHYKAQGSSWVTDPDRMGPPLGAPVAARLLPPLLIDIMRRCFTDGAAAPEARPSASEWRTGLLELAGNLQTCPRNRNHVFRGGRRRCPWCERAALEKRDPFPRTKRTALAIPWLDELLGATPRRLRPTETTASSDPIFTGDQATDLMAKQWRRLERIRQRQGTVIGTVTEVLPSGLIIDAGLPALLPITALGPVTELETAYVPGARIEAKIVVLDRAKRHIELSRQAYLESLRAEYLRRIRVGDVVDAVVTGFDDHGMLVEVEGVPGRVRHRELSWRRHASRPDPGQRLRLKVLAADREASRLDLSLRELDDDDWSRFFGSHQAREFIQGIVSGSSEWGAVVTTDKVPCNVFWEELGAPPPADGDIVFAEIMDIDERARSVFASIDRALGSAITMTEFDPARYGMVDEYDDDGEYNWPTGFDREKGVWQEGFEIEQADWESRYARAHERFEAHLRFQADRALLRS